MPRVLILTTIFLGLARSESCVYPNKAYKGDYMRKYETDFPTCRDGCMENMDCAATHYEEETSTCYVLKNFDITKLQVLEPGAGNTVFRKNCHDTMYRASKTYTCKIPNCFCYDNYWRCVGVNLMNVDLDKLIIPETVEILSAYQLQRLIDAGIFDRTNLKNLTLASVIVNRFPDNFFQSNHWEFLQLRGMQLPYTTQQILSLSRAKSAVISISNITNGQDWGSCKDGNCFQICGDMPYQNKLKALTGTVFALKYDVTNIPSNIRQIYAMFVRGSIKTTDHPLTIVSREVRLDSFIASDGCQLTAYQTPYGTWYKLIEDKLTIFAQEMHSPIGKCKIIRADDQVTTEESSMETNGDDWLAIQFVRGVTECAKMVNEKYKEDQISERIIDSVLSFVSAGTHKLPRAIIHELISVKSGLKDNRDIVRYVPNLATRLIGEILKLQGNAAEKYNEKLLESERRNSTADGTLILLKVLHNQADNLANSNEIGLKQIEDAAEQSRLVAKKLHMKFNSVERDLDYAENVLMVGLGLEIASATIDIGLSVFKWLVLDFSASKEAAEAVAQLIKIGERIAALIKTVGRVSKATSQHDYTNLAHAETYLDDLDKAADLTKQVIEWKRMAKAFHILLSQGAAATLFGSSKYQQLIQEWCIIGEAMTMETIRQIQLLRQMTTQKAKLRARADSKKYIEGVIENRGNDKNTKEAEIRLYKALVGELYEAKWGLSETLESYCQAYFYYHFADCGVRPAMSDTIESLSRKINKAKVQYLHSLAFSGRSQTVPQAVIRIKDRNTCPNDTIDCPISMFKQNQTLTYKVDLDESAFRDLDRVRVEEITVTIKGITLSSPEDAVYIAITNAGNFQDRYESDIYNFTSYPFSMGFKYKPNNAYCKFRNTRLEGNKKGEAYNTTANECFNDCLKERTCEGATYVKDHCQQHSKIQKRQVRRRQPGYTLFTKKCRSKLQERNRKKTKNVCAKEDGEILVAAKIDDNDDQNFQQMSPFTTWVFRLIDTKDRVDLSHVTEVAVNFRGRAIPVF